MYLFDDLSEDELTEAARELRAIAQLRRHQAAADAAEAELINRETGGSE